MRKKIFLGIFITAAVALLICIHILINHKPEAQYQAQTNLSAPIEIPAEEITDLKEAQSGKPSVIMFYVDWCGFCRRFMPIYGKIAKKYNNEFNFTVVNCDKAENQEIINKYNIAAFPTIFIKDNDLDFEYQISTAATISQELFENELEKHKKLRSKLKI